jgi:hypothetical protein
MKTATRKTAPRKAAAPTMPFSVPEPIDRALKTAAEKVGEAREATMDVAAKVEKKVRTAAESARKTGKAIAKDPRGFAQNAVREGKSFGKKLTKSAEKVRTDVSKEGKRIADDVSRRVSKAVESVVAKTLHRFNVPTRQELKNLTAKVEGLGKKIDSLTKTRARARAAR